MGTISFPRDLPISPQSQDFIRRCLTFDEVQRPSVFELLQHPLIKQASLRQQLNISLPTLLEDAY